MTLNCFVWPFVIWNSFLLFSFPWYYWKNLRYSCGGNHEYFKICSFNFYFFKRNWDWYFFWINFNHNYENMQYLFQFLGEVLGLGFDEFSHYTGVQGFTFWGWDLMSALTVPALIWKLKWCTDLTMP